MLNQLGRVILTVMVAGTFAMLAANTAHAAPGGNGGGKPGGEEPPPDDTGTGCTGIFPAMAYTKPVYGKRGRIVGTKLFLADATAHCEVEVFENEVGIDNISFVFVYDSDSVNGTGTLAWSQYRDDNESSRNGRDVVKVAEFSTAFDGNQTTVNNLPLQNTAIFRGVGGGGTGIHGLDLSADRSKVAFSYQEAGLYSVFEVEVVSYCEPASCGVRRATRIDPNMIIDVAWSRADPAKLYFVAWEYTHPNSQARLIIETGGEQILYQPPLNYSLKHPTVFTSGAQDEIVFGERASLDGTDGPDILKCLLSVGGTACGGFIPFEGAASQSWTADKKLLIQKRLQVADGGNATPSIWEVDPATGTGIQLRPDGGPIDASY